jgi:uridylate kinase
VDGVYSADPMTDHQAIRYEHLTFDEVLSRNLGVMDQTAIVMCRDHDLPLRVYDVRRPGALRRIIMENDRSIGTTVACATGEETWRP